MCQVMLMYEYIQSPQRSTEVDNMGTHVRATSLPLLSQNLSPTTKTGAYVMLVHCPGMLQS